MMKCLAKTTGIGDASRGSLSSYAYSLMSLYFLQQVEPPVIPVLQEVNMAPESHLTYLKSKTNKHLGRETVFCFADTLCIDVIFICCSWLTLLLADGKKLWMVLMCISLGI